MSFKITKLKDFSRSVKNPQSCDPIKDTFIFNHVTPWNRMLQN